MRYRFGEFELDEGERQLRRSGAVVDVGGRAFDLLCALIKAPGRLLAKDALMDAVWPNLFVTENNLQVQVSGLRRILGTHSIATVAGRGYRFMPDVRPADEEDIAPSPTGPVDDLPLIGRAEDLTRVMALLAEGGVTTLTGAGGIGKTSLARVVAERARRAGRTVAWVDLAPIRESGLLLGLMAEACGAPAAGEPSLADLVARLRGADWLLVLDNAEHLVDAVAAIVEPLAAGAPLAQILVTSQTPLRVTAERTYRLEGLDLPQADAGPQAVLESGAGALMLTRARALDRRFALTDENAPAIAAICRRLEGSPLALELAASRLSLFGPRELERRLDQRFEVLTRGRRTAPTRQQTLHAVLEWSYGLLPEPGRALFRRLGAFSGAFPLAWACAIGTVGGQDDWAVMDALGDLLDRSLVEAADAEGGLYRLTETGRAFALEKLAGARDDAALACAVGLYSDAAVAAERPREAVTALSAALELQRRRQALGEPPDETLALLLRLGPAVQTAISPADPRCGALYEEALSLARAAGDRLATFHAIWGVWHYLCMSGELRRAEPYAAELAALAPGLGDDGLELEAWHATFTTQQLLGDAAAVVAATRRAQALYDPARHQCLGDRFGGHDAGVCACGQGAVGLWLTGSPAEAAAQVDAAMTRARAARDPYSRAVGLFYAAMTLQGLGQTEAFARAAAALRDVSDEHGLSVLGSEAELLAGRAAYEAGDNGGVEAMRRAFDDITGSGDTGFGIYYACLLADALIATGEAAAAADLLRTAMTFAAQGQGFFLPELYRLRARTPGADAAADLAEAARLARSQHATALEQRAAADLVAAKV